MKQILQSFTTGETILEELPIPSLKSGSILIQTSHSLVSLGTERMLVEFGKANLIQKARQQPEKVKMVLDKIKTDGLLPTIETVFKRLEQPLPLGYCNVGKVIAVGHGVSNFNIGDRVASNGPHAEYVCVPKNLAAKIPENVNDEQATFTVIGSIGLQGIRLCNPTLGETIVVIGLGLIGLITTQLLMANGCRVIGIDIDPNKCQIAESWGVETLTSQDSQHVVKSVLQKTGEIGADGVIISASAKTDEIVSQAAQLSRKRGRIVLIGVVGLNLSRAEFYEKELSFQVSCSYGPGRYDESYEQKGIDYPLPYVRWTEQRNFETILYSLSTGRVNVDNLITEVVELENYDSIYRNIGSSKSIASILKYPENQVETTSIEQTLKITKPLQYNSSKGVIGIIGAGNFTKMTMLPNMKKSGAIVKYIASSKGVSGTNLAKKFSISYSTTNYRKMLEDPEVDGIMIATRHNSHSYFVVEALKANKHVFVEKPLALNEKQLSHVVQAYKASEKNLVVGFNRRFSPHIQAIKKSLGDGSGLININATMNAGFIPKNTWIHDLEVGGGRIIGEACHYIDLCVFLAGSNVRSVCMSAMGRQPSTDTDNATILLKFENGSNAAVNYFSNGSKSYSKERIEVYSQERSYIVDNFRKTTGYGVKGFKSLRTRINKGHEEQFNRYIEFLKTGNKPLIPIDQLINVAQTSFAAIESIQKNMWIDITPIH